MDDVRIESVMSAKHEEVTDSHEFRPHDYMTFSFIQEEQEMTTLNVNYVCKIRKIEGRYMVIDYSEKPIVAGELNMAHINRTLTIKLNGHANCTMMGPNGLTPVRFPFADIVNISGSIVFKTVLRQEEANNEKAV